MLIHDNYQLTVVKQMKKKIDMIRELCAGVLKIIAII